MRWSERPPPSNPIPQTHHPSRCAWGGGGPPKPPAPLISHLRAAQGWEGGSPARRPRWLGCARLASPPPATARPGRVGEEGGGQPPGRHAAGQGPMQREGGRVSGESGGDGVGEGVSHAQWDGGWRRSEGQRRGRITGHGGVAAATQVPPQALRRRLLPGERHRGCGREEWLGLGGGEKGLVSECWVCPHPEPRRWGEHQH